MGSRPTWNRDREVRPLLWAWAPDTLLGTVSSVGRAPATARRGPTEDLLPHLSSGGSGITDNVADQG